MFDVCTTGDTAHIDMICKLLLHTRHRLILLCSMWLQMSINLIVGWLQTEHLANGDQWKVTDAGFRLLR